MQMLLQFHILFLSRIKYIILKPKLFTRLEMYFHSESHEDEEMHKESRRKRGGVPRRW